MDIFFSVILISGVYAVSRKPGEFAIAIALALPALIFQWMENEVPAVDLTLVAQIFGALFFIYTTITILTYLFQEHEVNADVIMGGVCVYFLIGMAWSIVFSMLEHLHPGSFHIPGNTDVHLSYLSYYSFVTLTTLGYGDITPISSAARSLSLLEACMGQLYPAILLARLVGLHISHSSSGQKD